MTPTIAHNLELYRLQGFTGRRNELLTLDTLLTGGDDLPAIAISGEQGAGKSSLATAAAWNHLRTFSDGVLRVSPAGTSPFRLYDIARAMDVVFRTTMTRGSTERWGVSMLEQLYRRKRLIILDKLAGATEREVRTLVEIIGHLHESGGHSRLILIDRNFHPAIAELVGGQHVRLGGLAESDVAEFIRRRAPQTVRERALVHAGELHALTGGAPLTMRLALGLLMDLEWDEMASLLRDFCTTGGAADVFQVATLAIETHAAAAAHVGPLLERLVTAQGGASDESLRALFWQGLGSESQLQNTIDGLAQRGILERDALNRRVVLHPVVRRYLEQNAAMLGENWERRHSTYFVQRAGQYLTLPLDRWPEVDTEWGNIFKGADWCQQRVERIWQRRALDMVSDAALDGVTLALPPEVERDAAEIRADLRLTRDYALALAHYAFWRHPPGIVAWLSAGAVAASAMGDPRNYAWFLMSIGRQFFFMGEVEKALSWFERARAIFDPRDLLAELAYVCTDLGTTLRILDQPRRALAYFDAAFDCSAQLGEQQSLATAYMNLGSAYYSVGSFEQAIAQHRMALRIGLRRQEPGMAGSALNNMGLVLEATERFDDALAAYQSALRHFEQAHDTAGISAAYNNLGSASFARQDFSAALEWYERDLGLLEKRGAWTDMAATLHNLGHVALELGDTDRATAYFERSRDLYGAFELSDYVAEEQEMMDYIQQQGTQAPARKSFFQRFTR
jgi:tetratricopeptide (TPR) repeat protein